MSVSPLAFFFVKEITNPRQPRYLTGVPTAFIETLKRRGYHDVYTNNLGYHLLKISPVDSVKLSRQSDEDASKKQIGNCSPKEHNQSEVTDLAKMEALMTGPAEAGKLQEKKEWLYT